jgi:XTP/dITP diphosphohydrolase
MAPARPAGTWENPRPCRGETRIMKLVIATQNRNKIIEIRDKFAGVSGLELVSLGDFPGAPDIVEDGDTFRDNAAKKARGIAAFTGRLSMADDSGLVVDALGGRPGVYSARYGGASATDEDRNRAILEEMRDVPPPLRAARFVCVIALCTPEGECLYAEGECGGVIADTMKGSRGFGYDPIFFLPDRGKTMAELPLEEKNRISHRAQALEKARELLMKMDIS